MAPLDLQPLRGYSVLKELLSRVEEGDDALPLLEGEDMCFYYY